MIGEYKSPVCLHRFRVDSLQQILRQPAVSPTVADLLRATEGHRRLVVTAHRRESFGAAQAAQFRTLRSFVERHADVVLLFPVHPNPAVNGPAHALLAGRGRFPGRNAGAVNMKWHRVEHCDVMLHFREPGGVVARAAANVED